MPTLAPERTPGRPPEEDEAEGDFSLSSQGAGSTPPIAEPDLIPPTRAFDREILAEEGFPSDFPLQLHLRLDKFRRSEAMPALYRLRDRLGPDKSLFLFQNETELPPPR